jgi:hypothetical protein
VVTISLAPIAPAHDRCLPVDEVFAAMLPDAGLTRGRVVGCSGPAAVSLALALSARAVVSGSWLAVVGVPMVGIEAAADFGVPLSRLVQVGVDGGPGVWAERVAAAADGFDVVMTRPPTGAERVVRKVRQRLQARGVVAITVGATSPGVSCDLEFSTTSIDWVGLGRGSGHLVGRRASVRLAGRRIPRPVERELWLPGPDGRVAATDTVADTVADSVADETGIDSLVSGSEYVELGQAG